MAVNDEIFKNLAQYGGGTINERVYNFLGSLGYTGTISDRLGQFEEGGRKGWQGLIRAWGQWAPAQLFSQGQEGVWYEPKPIVAGQQVLYQDAAGTTPVAADGDPVGLMLDRHKGLLLSGNLVATPEPSTAQLDVSGGDLITNSTQGDPLHETWVEFGSNTDTTFAYMSPNLSSLVAEFTIDVEMLDSDSPPILGSSSNSSANFGVISFNKVSVAVENSSTTKIAPFRYRIHVQRLCNADGSSNYFGVVCYTSHTFRPFRVSGFDVKETPGNHATQSTSAARPIYRTDGTLHWLEFDGVDDRLLTSSIQFGQNWTAAASARFSGNAMSVLDADDSVSNIRQAQLLRSTSSGGAAQSIVFNEATSAFIASGGADLRGVDAVLLSQTASSQLKLRTNGSNQGTVAIAGTPVAKLSAVSIGSRVDSEASLQYLNGRIYGSVVVADESSQDGDLEQHLAKLAGITL